MVLVRVLLGHPHVIHSRVKFNRAPCQACKKASCKCNTYHHDSVIYDSRGEAREFIVYDNSQCYPEYFIQYKVVP
jgi:hypothetical protein